MNNTATILQQLDNFLKQEDLKLRKLASLANLNAGTLSSLLNKQKVLTVDHLDRLTSVMNLPEGHFYDQYIEEFLNNTTPNWRRIRPFLYRCADLNKLDCIPKIINLLMDNLMYSPLLFEVAEDFYQNGKRGAAALLFESVALSERQQHSERLAFCQYRLFLLRLGSDLVQNYQAVIQFEPFLDRLDEIDQLDALKDLANACRALHQWDKVETLAKSLEASGKAYYQWTHHSERKKEMNMQKMPTRPLFFYVAYAYLLRACVYEAQRNYTQALRFTCAYADLSWVKETDPDTRHWIGLFKAWAQANTYAYKLLSGDTRILPEYVQHIERNREEILPGLFNIIEAANRLDMDVDEILQRFESHITEYIQVQADSRYADQLMANAFTEFLHELAFYYFHRGMYSDGFKYLLNCLELSSKINNKSSIIKSVGLFEHNRDQASSETKTAYQNLVNGVYEDEKKKTASLFGI